MVFVNHSNYPKSDIFIRNIPAESLGRILKCGWAIDKTLFFELPYLPVSGVGAGIVRDYQHQVYYKVFYATQGVIPTLTDSEIQVIADHEQDEINKAVNNAVQDSVEGAFIDFDRETKRHKRDFRWIENRCGKEVVEAAIQKVHSAAVAKPMIPRYVVLFWLSFFLMTHYDRFGTYSFPMNQAMLSEKQRAHFQQLIRQAVDEYGPCDAPIEEWMKLHLSAKQSS